MEYTYTQVKLSNGNTINYKIINDTAYHKETPDEVVEILERVRQARERIRVYFGDAKTGLDWEERYDILGYVGRSTGTIKIPLLVHNSRSMGGGALLDHCIVKIEYSNKNQGGVLYQHANYHKGDK